MRKFIKTEKKPTAPGVPKWSPIQVLSRYLSLSLSLSLSLFNFDPSKKQKQIFIPEALALSVTT
jgi:hypothetical protein